MARFELKLPKMGESVAEATITSWLKEVGEDVELDDAIVEVATDKVDSEVPCEVEGKLIEILFTKDDVVVVLIHDHGSRYVGKIFNDSWMRERGFLEAELKVKDLIVSKKHSPFISVKKTDTVHQIFQIMKENDISQLPVMEDSELIGSVVESKVLEFLLENPMQNAMKQADQIMGEPFPIVNEELPCRNLSKYISKMMPAVIAKDKTGGMHILTQYDIIQAV